MSEEKAKAWTPEPWNVDDDLPELHIVESDGNRSIAKFSQIESRDTGEANRARAVDCVNAMAGVENPAALVDELAALRLENAKLRADAQVEEEEFATMEADRDRLAGELEDEKARREVANQSYMALDKKWIEAQKEIYGLRDELSVAMLAQDAEAWRTMEKRVEEAKSELEKVRSDRDEALAKWHAHQKSVPCAGCEGGHDTYWKTVTESPQWLEWEKAADGWDVDECRECGHISQGHFQAFLEFILGPAKAEALRLREALEKFVRDSWFDPLLERGACEFCDGNMHPDLMGKHGQVNGKTCLVDDAKKLLDSPLSTSWSEERRLVDGVVEKARKYREAERNHTFARGEDMDTLGARAQGCREDFDEALQALDEFKKGKEG